MFSFDTTMAANKEQELEAAQKHFKAKLKYPSVEVSINVRRLRKKNAKFGLSDLVFTLNFNTSEEGNIPIIATLISVHKAVLTLVSQLKRYFKSQSPGRRFVFFSAHMEGMISVKHVWQIPFNYIHQSL